MGVRENGFDARGGRAPDEFRCVTFLRRKQRRCSKWRMRGSEHCSYHGGRRDRLFRPMPKFYSQVLSKTLRERFDGLMSAPHREMISLFEELALTRAAASENIRMASAILDAEKMPVEARRLALGAIQESCSAVSEMVERLAKVEQLLDKDSVSVNVIDLYVKQIVRAVYSACGADHQDIAQRIKDEIENLTYGGDEKSRRVSMQKIVGTVITPDRAVIDMDASVLGSCLVKKEENTNGRTKA